MSLEGPIAILGAAFVPRVGGAEGTMWTREQILGRIHPDGADVLFVRSTLRALGQPRFSDRGSFPKHVEHFPIWR